MVAAVDMPRARAVADDGNDGPRDLVLDGIRGLAILLVLLVHSVEFQGGGIALTWLNAFARSGWLGVDLFFVLSGYLITRILLQTRERPGYFKNFYARRALRIFPAYYLYLAVVFLVLPLWVTGLRLPAMDEWQLPSLLYVQNIKMAVDGSATPWRGLDHLWSLAIEEQFYLLWPLILWRCPPRFVESLCLGMIVLAWSCKLLLLTMHDWPMAGYVLMPTRMDALAAGGWVAARLHLGEPRDAPRWMGIAAWLAVLALAAIFLRDTGLRLHGATRIAGITSAAAIAFAGGLYLCMRRGLQPRLLVNAPLRTLGRYSYGIYLIHIAVIELVRVDMLAMLAPVFGKNAAMLGSAAVTIALTVLVAAVMYHAYEQPFLRLKRHFAHRDRRATAA
jgi:peptidoglycan/LPS O-acetylase OafA/YrhL